MTRPPSKPQLTVETVKPLLEASASRHRSERQAALRGLVALPLPEAVREQVAKALITELRATPTKLDPKVAALAARVQVPTLTSKIRALSRSMRPDAVIAARALAQIADPTGIDVLLRDLGNRSAAARRETARALARLDEPPEASILARIGKERDPILKFWLSVAAASSGELQPLIDWLAHIEARDPAYVTAWQTVSPAVTPHAFSRPAERQLLRWARSATEPLARAIAQQLVGERGPQLLRPEPTVSLDVLRTLRRNEPTLPWNALDMPIADMPEHRTELVEILVKGLGGARGLNAETRSQAGDALAQLALATDGFEPSPRELLDAHRTLKVGDRVLGAQIGWMASRAGVRPLLEWLDRRPYPTAAERTAALDLFADAAEQARYARPIVSSEFSRLATSELARPVGHRHAPTTVVGGLPPEDVDPWRGPSSPRSPGRPETLTTGPSERVGSTKALPQAEPAEEEPETAHPQEPQSEEEEDDDEDHYFAGEGGRGGGTVGAGDPEEAEEEIKPPPGEPPLRYLNAALFDGAMELAATAPIQKDRPYTLQVDVGPHWGLGRAEVAFPDAAVATAFARAEVLELELAIQGRDVEAKSPRAKLSLPRRAASDRLSFGVRFLRTGRLVLDIDLLFQGHLLQSRRITVSVTPASAAAGPGGLAAESRIIFTRSGMLSHEEIEGLATSPRRLTVVAARDPDDSIVLRFHGAAEAGEVRHTTLTSNNLKTILGELRQTLNDAVEAYTGVVGGNDALLAASLAKIAHHGRRLYRQIFVDDGDDVDMDGTLSIVPGEYIQFAPLTAGVTIPWEALYRRRVLPNPADVRLCPSYREHLLAACPAGNDPAVVCPYQFWGYRYVIEQLPCRVDSDPKPPAKPMALLIRNGRPTALYALCSTRLKQRPVHVTNLKGLAAPATLAVEEIVSLADARRIFEQRIAAGHVVYFYTHGGMKGSEPFLEIGNEPLTESLLDAWNLDLPGRPLIVFNACESAAYSPDSFDNLIRFFYKCGAAGIVGTQCAVKELLANEFASSFLRSFLKSQPLGPALLNARRALLGLGDPRGLVYSLFAAAETRLAQPVIT